MTDANQSSPVVALGSMMNGYKVSRAIYVAAKLGIADLLKSGPKHIDELATSVEANPGALYRVLRFLASLSIFTENEQGIFKMTPLAEPLQTGVSGSLRDIIILIGEEWFWRPWGDILHSVTTGKAAFDHCHGMSMFDYLSQNPEAANIFDAAMSNFTDLEMAAILAAYNFSEITRVVDVGGGQGLLIVAILKANPHLEGILFDLDHVLEGVKNVLVSEGVVSRCELVGGDFFESVPDAGEIYILKSVLHDWDNDQAVAILKNCRRSIADGGKLLIIERIIPPGNEPSPGKDQDLIMLVMLGGQERTKAKYQVLLRAASFELIEVIPTSSPLSIIEAVPV